MGMARVFATAGSTGGFWHEDASLVDIRCHDQRFA